MPPKGERGREREPSDTTRSRGDGTTRTRDHAVERELQASQDRRVAELLRRNRERIRPPGDRVQERVLNIGDVNFQDQGVSINVAANPSPHVEPGVPNSGQRIDVTSRPNCLVVATKCVWNAVLATGTAAVQEIKNPITLLRVGTTFATGMALHELSSNNPGAGETAVHAGAVFVFQVLENLARRRRAQQPPLGTVHPNPAREAANNFLAANFLAAELPSVGELAMEESPDIDYWELLRQEGYDMKEDSLLSEIVDAWTEDGLEEATKSQLRKNLDIKGSFNALSAWMLADSSRFWKKYQPTVDRAEEMTQDAILGQITTIELYKALTQYCDFLSPPFTWSVYSDATELQSQLISKYRNEGAAGMYAYMSSYQHNGKILPRSVACDVVASALGSLFESVGRT